jgi:two-component system response regulator AtoC
MASERVLIVDDEGAPRSALRTSLGDAGFFTEDVGTSTAAMSALRDGPRFHAALVNYKLPDGCGLELLHRIKASVPSLPVIVMTAIPSIETAVRSMKLGATDYATKPLDLDVLIHTLRAAIATVVEGDATSDDSRRHARARRSSDLPPPPLIGTSEAIQRVRSMIERVATNPVSTVLLTGESGTGKDVTARSIHQASSRAHRTFMNITCSALPEDLLESELFGHEAGAFTSATHRKKGLLELADGGTAFLDEIGEMTPRLQAKLLRFIEERAFRRVGATKDQRVDVRVIAATNRDLPLEVAAGRFREDLFYRLRVVPIHLPPLRERLADVEALASHFLEEFNVLFGKGLRGLSEAAVLRLREHDWPGNVRELKHTLERAVLLAEGEYVTAADCGPARSDSTDCTFRLPPGGLVLEQLERSLLDQALRASGWNQVRAGELLGLNRDQVRYRIEKFGLSPHDAFDHDRRS